MNGHRHGYLHRRSQFPLWRMLLAGLLGLSVAHYEQNVMQLMAWGGMIVLYSSQSDTSQALKETFDGEHPCALCCAIAKTKHAEGKTPTGTAQNGSPSKGVLYFELLTDILELPEPKLIHANTVELSQTRGRTRPLTPPPKQVFMS